MVQPCCYRAWWKLDGKGLKISILPLVLLVVVLTVLPVNSKFTKPKPGFFGDENDEEFLIRLKMFIKSMKLVHHRVREDIPWLPTVYPTPPFLQVSVPYLYNAVPPVPERPPGIPEQTPKVPQQTPGVPQQPPGVPQTPPGSYKS